VPFTESGNFNWILGTAPTKPATFVRNAGRDQKRGVQTARHANRHRSIQRSVCKSSDVTVTSRVVECACAHPQPTSVGRNLLLVSGNPADGLSKKNGNFSRPQKSLSALGFSEFACSSTIAVSSGFCVRWRRKKTFMS